MSGRWKTISAALEGTKAELEFRDQWKHLSKMKNVRLGPHMWNTIRFSTRVQAATFREQRAFPIGNVKKERLWAEGNDNPGGKDRLFLISTPLKGNGLFKQKKITWGGGGRLIKIRRRKIHNKTETGTGNELSQGSHPSAGVMGLKDGLE